MIRFYIIPIQEVIGSSTTYRGPKYIKWRMNPTGLGIRWSMMGYGLMTTAIIACQVDQAQHSYLAGQSDIVSVPENIDANISSGALATVKQELENLHIPAGWVTTSHTYRTVLRMVAGLFQFAQRYHGRHREKLVKAGYNLDTQIKDLPTAVKNSLKDTTESFGWDTSEIKNNWKLRKALKHLADQWSNREIILGGITL